MQTSYLQAAATLARAEQQAWDARDFDTMSRLYLPLQEARRQIRQRCGEGAVCLHWFPKDSGQNSRMMPLPPQGQLLVGGWGSVQPAIAVRQTAADKSLYVESFLAAIYPIVDSPPVVVIVPWPESQLPVAEARSLHELRSLLPSGCQVLNQGELPPDADTGNADTFASVMDLWEKLHRPLLDAAAQISDSIQQMQAYRDILRADPACELAHQFLADIARRLARSG